MARKLVGGRRAQVSRSFAEACQRGCFFALFSWFALFAASPAARANAGAPPLADNPALEATIARLVVQLGDEQFVVRERAQAELERIGLPAFDALDAARGSDDIEVALRARYLLRVMSVSWIQDEDPPEVRNVLKNYGEQPESDRRSRMERLAAYGTPRALSALCRLARFETSPVLAKQAALLVMNATVPDDATGRTSFVKLLRETMGASKRPSCDWLRLYAQTVENPAATSEAWQRRAAAELTALNNLSPGTNNDVVRELLRWQCELLRRLKRTDEALAAARQVIANTDASVPQLTDLVTWLVEREYWALVPEVAKAHAREFEKSSLLLYRAAEAQLRQGLKEEAESTATRAFAINPEAAALHIESAMELRERGLYAWAERELRHAIAHEPPGERLDYVARSRLSEMLFDIQRPLDAAKVWQDLVDEVAKNAELRDRLDDSRQSFRARMHYFYSQHFAKLGDWAKVREHLDLAVRHDPTDADVLIAMHRLPNADTAWRQKAKGLIDAAATEFHDLVRAWEQRASAPNAPPDQREDALESLATSCNQYAWLVANTDGDVDEAIRLSHRSLEIMPNTASYLDTLGHCYYAKRDYVNAVKYQSMAAKREPHTMQIQRQYQAFQKALDQQKEKQ